MCCAICPSCSLLALYKKYKILNRKDPVDTRNSGTLNFQIKILPIFHQLYFCQNKLSLPDAASFAAMSHGYASAVWLHALSSVPVRITRREKHSVLTITDLEWFCSMDYNLSLKEQKKKKVGWGGKRNVGVGASGGKLNYLQLETNERTPSGLVSSLPCHFLLPLTRLSSLHWR